MEGDVNPIRDLEIIHEELRYGRPRGPRRREGVASVLTLGTDADGDVRGAG